MNHFNLYNPTRGRWWRKKWKNIRNLRIKVDLKKHNYILVVFLGNKKMKQINKKLSQKFYFYGFKKFKKKIRFHQWKKKLSKKILL